MSTRFLHRVLLLALATPSLSSAADSPAAPRERTPFNQGWHFVKSDSPDAASNLSYTNLRPWLLPTANPLRNSGQNTQPDQQPTTPEFAKPEFNDSSWRSINLPHDWGVEDAFKQEYPGETGKLAWWGTAWYRNTLNLTPADQGKQIFLDVDGAMSRASVWVNGKIAGGWAYGYASWRVNLTPFLTPGSKNQIAIRLDNPPESSRWYPGGGIYRNVWIVKTNPVHVAQWGTAVTTPNVDPRQATVQIQTTVDNDSSTDSIVTVQHEIRGLRTNGTTTEPVATSRPEPLPTAARKSATHSARLSVSKPALWNTEHPNRYVVITTIAQNGKITDRYESPFGIRTTAFDKDKGFFLNGIRTPLNGVCNHHDLGALGSAINLHALERQIRLLKEMGCNSIRTSHNPPAPELLDLCDQSGILVMDETFDCWKSGKTKNDYHTLFQDWHEADTRALVRRDRNHPSVILWSIGNEIPDQGKPEGPAIARELTDIVHSEDPTRPTTSACDRVPSGYNDFHKGVDVFGYNYKPREYPKFHKANPSQPLVGSETSSTVSTRGEYFFPAQDGKPVHLADFQVSSYDRFFPPWATTPDTEFQAQTQNPNVAGEYVWTGFDYLGEPTPYNSDTTNLLNFSNPADQERMRRELDELRKIRVPSRSSYFGILDLAGFPKDRFYLYQAHWRPELPMAHILPHWNWPDRVGKTTPVFVYTSGDSAELFLNGKSLGTRQKQPGEFRLCWNDVTYQPGTLKAVASKAGRKWAADEVKTTGPAAKLTLKADQSSARSNGNDLIYLTTTVADSNGLTVPRSHPRIHFEIQGPATIAATDNGNPIDLAPFQSPDHDAFNGLALAIIRPIPGQQGKVTVTATAEGLKPAAIDLQTTR